MEDYLLAVPSEAPGGLESSRSGHFGHCELFTILTLKDGKVVAGEVIDNPPHPAGGCLAPIAVLKEKGVRAIVVGGIGKRPLAGMQEAGISVLWASVEECPTVKDALDLMLAGKIEVMRPEFACSGHNCH